MKAALASVVLGAAACGGSIDASDNPASRSGLVGDSGVDGAHGATMVEATLGGRPFSAHGALAFFSTTQSSPGTPPVAILFPSDSDLTCDLLRSDATSNTVATFADSTILQLLLWTSGRAPRAGTYSVRPADAAAGIAMTLGATYYESGSSCVNVASGGVVDGTVSVSAVDAAEISGELELTFSNGDRATGHFDARSCMVPSVGDLMSLRQVCIR